MKKAAIFLDRDGVIIENRANYVLSWDDVEIFEPALEALAKYRHKDWFFVIVTNQSAIGRGLLELDVAHAINDQLIEIVQQKGGRIDQAVLCPHAPQDQCRCRKPEAGMLMDVASQLDIDLSRSIMIGDALTDLKAGLNAGVAEVILVHTGRGADQARLPEAANYPTATHADDLSEALNQFFSTDQEPPE